MTSQKQMIQEELLKLLQGDCGVRWGTVVWKITKTHYKLGGAKRGGGMESASLAEAIDYIHDHI